MSSSPEYLGAEIPEPILPVGKRTREIFALCSNEELRAVALRIGLLAPKEIRTGYMRTQLMYAIDAEIARQLLEKLQRTIRRIKKAEDPKKIEAEEEPPTESLTAESVFDELAHCKNSDLEKILLRLLDRQKAVTTPLEREEAILSIRAYIEETGVARELSHALDAAQTELLPEE